MKFRAFHWARYGSSSQQYLTISEDTEHLVQSHSIVELNQLEQGKPSQGKPSAQGKQSRVNRRNDGQAISGKPARPPRPANPPNLGITHGSGGGRPNQSARPPRPDPPTSIVGRRPVDGPPKQRPPRPDPPASVGGRRPTDGPPKQLGDVLRPPRPDPPASVVNRVPIDGLPKQRPPRPDPPASAGGRGPTDGPPKQLGDVLRPPRPDRPFSVGGRGATDNPAKQLEQIVRPPRPAPPSMTGKETQKLTDTRRKQPGGLFRPQRPDPPLGIGSRRVNEDDPKTSCGNQVMVTKKTENFPNRQPGSPVKDSAIIKLPKRRSSLQRNTSPEKSEVTSPVSQNPDVKSPGNPLEAERNRVAALRQRLLEMPSLQQKQNRKISIPVSKSEGNVAKKTRSFEDKLCGGLAPTLFPLFNKPRKNQQPAQGKPTLRRSYSASSIYDSVNFEVFFNS